jgi:quercetin dioxygenase-like cupin family protein
MDQTKAASELVFKAILPEDIRWMELPVLPKSARLADIVDHPSQPAPYVIRVKVSAGTRVMPHVHPENRIYTVMSGIFYIGLGEEFKEENLMAFPPGSVVVLPGNTPHFHWAKSGEYVSQIIAVGPIPLEAA